MHTQLVLEPKCPCCKWGQVQWSHCKVKGAVLHQHVVVPATASTSGGIQAEPAVFCRPHLLHLPIVIEASWPPSILLPQDLFLVSWRFSLSYFHWQKGTSVSDMLVRCFPPDLERQGCGSQSLHHLHRQCLGASLCLFEGVVVTLVVDGVGLLLGIQWIV